MNEPTPSDTPDTDAKAIRHCANWSNCGDHVKEIVFADFARTLERQRNEARAERDTLAEALRRIRDGEDAPEIDATGEWQIGLFCGVEDSNCCDRYEGAEFGHAVGVEKALEWAKNEAETALATLDQKDQ